MPVAVDFRLEVEQAMRDQERLLAALTALLERTRAFLADPAARA